VFISVSVEREFLGIKTGKWNCLSTQK